MHWIASVARVVATSVLLAGAVSFVVVLATPDTAIAKSGNGKGGGNDGGKGKGADKSSDRGGAKSGNSGRSSASKGKSGQGKGFLSGLGLSKPKAERKSAKSKNRSTGQNGFVAKLDNLFRGKKKAEKPIRKARVAPVTVVVDVLYAKPNTHGKIASELKGLNAAHANQTALMNAAPNSMPGKLYSYQRSIVGYSDAAEDLDQRERDLADLQGLTETEIENQFAPTEEEAAEGITAQDKYEDAVAEAEEAVTDAEHTLAEADDPQEALDTLTGGRDLSDPALHELHDLLGLPAPIEQDDEVSIDTKPEQLPQQPVEQTRDG